MPRPTVAKPLAASAETRLYALRMIIEAGYDLHVLLFSGHSEPGALRMVCLDADLRVTDVCTVTPSFSGSFDAATLESITMAIPDNDDDLPKYDTRFVALGYAVADASGYPEGFDMERVRILEELLGCRGVRLLGIQVSDQEQWASTGPMYSFGSYLLADELPRVVVIPGPHPFDSCECVACAPRRQHLRPGRSVRSV